MHYLMDLLMCACVAAGGFAASGFKRAFKMKDFGDTIPGHGGVTDRFDCQVGRMGPCTDPHPILPGGINYIWDVHYVKRGPAWTGAWHTRNSRCMCRT